MRRRLVAIGALLALFVGLSGPLPSGASATWTASDLATLVTTSLKAKTLPASLNPKLNAALPIATSQSALAKYMAPYTGCDALRFPSYATNPRPCYYGDTSATQTLVIFGGGSNLAWTVALDAPLKAAHIRIALFEFSGCASANIVASPTLFPQAWRNCNIWHQRLAPAIIALNPFAVLTSSGAYEAPVTDAAWVAAYADQINQIRAGLPDARVILMGSTPIFSKSVPTCLRDHQKSVQACTFLETTLIKDPKTFTGNNAEPFTQILARDHDVATASGATLIETEPWLCSAGRCPAVIGSYLVYRDDRHFFHPFLVALGPVVDQALRDAGLYSSRT